jgi:hypothetical protein
MSRTIWLAVPFLLACQSAPAPAPSAAPAGGEAAAGEAVYPDLRGSWTTTVRAIYSGSEGPHDFGAQPQPINVASLRFTVTIEFQDGALFYGTVQSTGEAERLFGAIRSDGKEAVYTTSLGQGTFYFRSADEMESCSTRGTYRSLLATCNVLHREPALRLEPTP